MNAAKQLHQGNIAYLESLFAQFQADPESVDEHWRMFFEGVNFAKNLGEGSSVSIKELNVYNLIQSYRDYGHLVADLNPLNRSPADSERISLKTFHLSDADLDSTFQVGSTVGLPGAKLRDIIARLRESYCGTLTVRVAECSPEVRQWFQVEIEQKRPEPLSPEKRREILHQLARTEALEKFLHSRFVGAKRFSIEGGDAMIPMLESLVLGARALGVEELVIGMAHRGRINVLANFMHKALRIIFAEFDGHHYDGKEDIEGDVKYHNGTSADKPTPHGQMHVSLAFNPSHLEAVCPVVCGMVRAKQRIKADTQERRKVVPVLIHGDAAFAGQGVVFETFQLSQLEGYRVGGSIHIIVDNQIGFTADPNDTRSSPYSSDLAKSLLIPVIHANGDDPEACVRAMDIALRYRHEFRSDIVIDLMCYRRHGHNEGDEPTFTQPLMYQMIAAHPTAHDLYAKRLEEEGVIDSGEARKSYDEMIEGLQGVLDEARKTPPEIKPVSFDGIWKGLRSAKHEDFLKAPDTRVTESVLHDIGKVISTLPEGFDIHPKLRKLIDSRRKMAEGAEPVDWGMAELLAYGSLMREGNSVRLSGQDSIRGTFAHRHSCFYDMRTGERFNTLSAVNPEKEFCVYDSPLSEYAVLGFEYGNSSSDPTFLTLWEAQFGDFSNGAQIIIDQFLASAETKWHRMNGLVLLLPHGYEGQGPEHSSARLERYLQLCAKDNLQVCNVTTPAQLFHLLRRQLRRDFRKPLILMTPKSLLRHPKVRSSMGELSSGAFCDVLPDPRVTDPESICRVVLTSGKLYYDIDDQREKTPVPETAVLRLEQYYPFPDEILRQELSVFSRVKEFVWAQEEARNMGAWNFIEWRLRRLSKALGWPEPLYAGRSERASSATGSPRIHVKQQAEVVEAALGSGTMLAKEGS
ncbi:MAG: 2-oxoglutarate dehydrogenase E1 component [Planctomycetota bacterium]